MQVVLGIVFLIAVSIVINIRNFFYALSIVSSIENSFQIVSGVSSIRIGHFCQESDNIACSRKYGVFEKERIVKNTSGRMVQYRIPGLPMTLWLPQMFSTLETDHAEVLIVMLNHYYQ